MADPYSLIGTLPRAELAKLFPSPRVRAAFETLIGNVQVTLPDQISELADTVSQIEGLEAVSQAVAARALQIASQALRSAEEGPPVQVFTQTADDAPPTAILERLAALERAVSQLSEGPTPL